MVYESGGSSYYIASLCFPWPHSNHKSHSKTFPLLVCSNNLYRIFYSNENRTVLFMMCFIVGLLMLSTTELLFLSHTFHSFSATSPFSSLLNPVHLERLNSITVSNYHHH
uniref:Uncharacterized protein n=1 Tax=Salix viminalis TaxID=40686 RepID=A0A6N2LV07_SALVM